MRSLRAKRKMRGPPPARSRRGPRERRASFEHEATWKQIALFLPRLAAGWRPVLLLSVVLVAATIVAALFAGGYIPNAIGRIEDGADAVVADSGFGISAIRLSGNVHATPAAIIKALGFEPGQSIFGADIQTARARLLMLDWVSDAQVRRQYPDSISVTLVEKLPFALWQTENGLFVVERSGRIITRARAVDYPHLPLFLGEGAAAGGAQLVDAIVSHRAVVARVKAMERISDRRWNLLLDDGVIVELPESGWAKQLDELEHLIVDKGVLERDISEIDLRSPDNLFFRLRNGSQESTRGNST